MVLAAPTVLPHVPAARRGLAGGAIFTGVGLGIAASGTLVPLFLRWGLTQAWCGLGALALVFTAVGWTGWPRDAGRAPDGHAGERTPRLRSSVSLKAIYVEYAPQRDRPRCRTWSFSWTSSLAGSAAVSTSAAGTGCCSASARCWGRCWRVARPIASGSGRPLRWALALQVAAVGGLAIWTSTGLADRLQSCSSARSSPAWCRSCSAGCRSWRRRTTRTAAWGRATTAFAIGLTAAGYGFSFVYARTASYAMLFALGGAFLALALAIDLAVRPRADAGPPTAAAAPAPPRPAAR